MSDLVQLLLGIFGMVPIPLCVQPPSVSQFSHNRNQVMNPYSMENFFNSKLQQFMACILLLINRNNTVEFSSLTIFFKFLSKQGYGIHSIRVRLNLDSNQERGLPNGQVKMVCVLVYLICLHPKPRDTTEYWGSYWLVL